MRTISEEFSCGLYRSTKRRQRESGVRWSGIDTAQTQRALVEDHSHLYRIALREADVDVLRDHVKATARPFGQRCLHFQRSGEAELVWPDPA